MALPLALAAAALAACGGGGGAGSQTTSSSPPPASASVTGPEAAPSAGSVTFGRPRPRATAATRAERERAGNAASFVKPGQDNSVPTFGTEASAAERGEAEAALRAYLSARAAHQWARACGLLAPSVRHGFERLAASAAKPSAGRSCAQVMPALAPTRPGMPADPLVGALVAFRVHGKNAFALFYGPPRHQQYIVPMNREAGAWRPTQVAPIAYPPGSSPTKPR